MRTENLSFLQVVEISHKYYDVCFHETMDAGYVAIVTSKEGEIAVKEIKNWNDYFILMSYLDANSYVRDTGDENVSSEFIKTSIKLHNERLDMFFENVFAEQAA